MPKILDNPQEKILEAARKKIKEGPDQFSMRILAKEANLSVGTIYKYYPDKIYLLAHVMYEQWSASYDECMRKCQQVASYEELASKIYELINDFSASQQANFSYYKTDKFNEFYQTLHPRFASMIKALWLAGKERVQIDTTAEEDDLIVEIFIISSWRIHIKEQTFIDSIGRIARKGK